jgi:hypothetical protein
MLAAAPVHGCLFLIHKAATLWRTHGESATNERGRVPQCPAHRTVSVKGQVRDGVKLRRTGGHWRTAGPRGPPDRAAAAPHAYQSGPLQRAQSNSWLGKKSEKP